MRGWKRATPGERPSERVTFWLPARIFTRSLARALVEQRRVLATSDDAGKRIVGMTLDADHQTRSGSMTIATAFSGHTQRPLLRRAERAWDADYASWKSFCGRPR